MTAVTKCYPGRSKSGNGDRVPTGTEQSFCRPYLDEETILIDTELIIPVGRRAIGIFYANKVSLKDIIGTQKQVEGRWIVHLPHPSGASRWHQIEANRDRIGEAVALIRHHVEHIFAK